MGYLVVAMIAIVFILIALAIGLVIFVLHRAGLIKHSRHTHVHPPSAPHMAITVLGDGDDEGTQGGSSNSNNNNIGASYFPTTATTTTTVTPAEASTTATAAATTNQDASHVNGGAAVVEDGGFVDSFINSNSSGGAGDAGGAGGAGRVSMSINADEDFARPLPPVYRSAPTK